jgi:hypothetical protein
MKNIQMPMATVQKLIDYLVQRPWSEADPLIDEIRRAAMPKPKKVKAKDGD